MAQAARQHSTRMSRRGMIGAALAASAVPATFVIPDAALVALGERLRAAWASESALFAREAPGPACDAAYAASKRIVGEIEGTQATTLAGLRVKALAISWCWGGTPFADEDATTDKRLMISLLDDLLVEDAG